MDLVSRRQRYRLAWDAEADFIVNQVGRGVASVNSSPAVELQNWATLPLSSVSQHGSEGLSNQHLCMEGLVITPDGRTPVGIMQNSLM